MRARPAKLLLLFAAASVLTRGPFLGIDVFDIDEATYLVFGRQMLRGKLLFVDLGDHHPPLAYVYYALCEALLGRGMLGVHFVTLAVTVPLTALALSGFFRHDRRGAVAGLLYVVYSAAFIGHDMLAANCELLLLLPACWAAVLVREASDAERPLRTFASGLLLGLAILFKQHAVFWLAALVVVVGRRWRAVATLLLGAAAPVAATALYYAWRGHFSDLYYWQVTHNLAYVANRIPPAEAATRFAANFLPFLAVTGGLWWCAWASRGRFASPHQARVVSALMLATLPTAFLGFRFYPHYFILLYAPLALAAAPRAAELLALPLRRAGKWLAAWTVVMVLGFALSTAILYARTDVYEETRPVARAVADTLRADPCAPGTSLFVWGVAPMLYYATDLAPASRFVHPDLTIVGFVPGNRASVADAASARSFVRSEHWDLLMSDLERSRPTFILDTSPAALHHWQSYPLMNYPRLWAFVRDGYEHVGGVDGVQVFRRLGCSRAP